MQVQPIPILALALTACGTAPLATPSGGGTSTGGTSGGTTGSQAAVYPDIAPGYYNTLVTSPTALPATDRCGGFHFTDQLLIGGTGSNLTMTYLSGTPPMTHPLIKGSTGVYVEVDEPLVTKIQPGSSGFWGTLYMPPCTLNLTGTPL